MHHSVDVPGDVPSFPGHIWTAGSDGENLLPDNFIGDWKGDPTAIRKKIQFFRRSQQKTLAPVNAAGKAEDGWKCLSIAIDSGACDNVIGPDDIPGYADAIKETPDSLAGNGFVSASGEDIPNYGEVVIPLITREHGIRAVKFQAAGVAKPLLSAEKLNQSGHFVVIDGDESCIINKSSYEVTALRREEGNFMLDVWVPPASVSRKLGFPRQP